MRTITDLKLNTKELIDETLAILDNSNVDYENAGIWPLIPKSEHLDDYVDVFVKGIPKTTDLDLIQAPKPGSEMNTFT